MAMTYGVALSRGANGKFGLTFGLARARNCKGITLVDVQPNSPAAEWNVQSSARGGPIMKAGDVISLVGGTPCLKESVMVEKFLTEKSVTFIVIRP